MIKSLFLLVLGLRLVVTEDFDPTKFDYCKHKCTELPPAEQEHTACTCNKLRGTGRKMIWEGQIDFRKDMVEAHNFFRNQLARGDEEQKYNFPSAANMHVLNYDLELEYIAYCHAKFVYFAHDRCNKKHNTVYSGQNIFSYYTKNRTGTDFHKLQVSLWYGEIKLVKTPAIIDFFFDNETAKDPGEKTGHFTMVIWAKLTHIGCVRVSMDKNLELSGNQGVYISICNYASLIDKYGGNLMKHPIYIKGKPCSQCPIKGEKCNPEYGGKWEALCGKDEPIPTRAPYEKKNIGEDDGKDKDKDKNGKSHGCRDSKNISIFAFLLLIAILPF